MAVIDVELTWRKLDLGIERSPTMRSNVCVCTTPKNSEMYLFGGRSSGGTNNHLYRMSDEIKTSGWRELKYQGSPPAPRKSSSMAYCAKKLWVFGGNTGWVLKKDLWSFDLELMAWQKERLNSSSSVPRARDRHVIIADTKNNRLILFGGHDGNNYLNDLWEYDIESRSWMEIKLKTRPPSRHEHCMVIVGESIIIFSGKARRGGLDDIWIAGINRLDVWTDLTAKFVYPDGELGHRWGSFPTSFENRYCVFYGGWDGRNCLNDIVVMDLEELRVTRPTLVGQQPSARVYYGAGILGNSMVIVAGRDHTKRLQDTYYVNLSPLAAFSSRSVKKRKRSSLRNKVLSISPGRSSRLRAPKEAVDAKSSEFRLMLERERRDATLGDLDMLRTLGKGTYGRVRLCRAKATGELFAIKIIRKAKVIKRRQENHIRWEKRILSTIRHPFIVNLEAAFQDATRLYLTLEFVQGGEFFNLLRKANVLRLPIARFYAAQIVLVLRFLHSSKIVYRDLKPENCLLNLDGYLKLADFGFAKRLAAKPYRTYTLCGTPEYLAPEILRPQGHGFAVDWWALGILLYEMLIGRPPFGDNDPVLIYKKIMKGSVRKWPRNIDVTVKEFITRLLVVDPEKRLGSQVPRSATQKRKKKVQSRQNNAEEKNWEEEGRDVSEHPFFRRMRWKQLLDKSMPAPFIPEVRGPTDTRHFDAFEEDTDEEPGEKQAFKNDIFKGDGW